jgi:hypothetical protein
MEYAAVAWLFAGLGPMPFPASQVSNATLWQGYAAKRGAYCLVEGVATPLQLSVGAAAAPLARAVLAVCAAIPP